MKSAVLLSLFAMWDYLLFVQYWPGCWIVNEHLHGTNFTNNHFNVHGIWPEYYNGSYPQFCNTTQKFNASQLTPIYNDLTTYWTDYLNATAFWEHEYSRHGICAQNDILLSTEFKFFNTGLALREKYDLYNYLSNSGIYPSNNTTYPISKIYTAIENVIQKKIVITCEKGIMDEIILCMDSTLELIDCPTNVPKCSEYEIKYNYITN
jgi:ribonuclease T2